jgi:hypothetical protein
MGLACGNAFYIELHHFEGDSPPSPDNASNNKGLNSFFFPNFFTCLTPITTKHCQKVWGDKTK